MICASLRIGTSTILTFSCGAFSTCRVLSCVARLFTCCFNSATVLASCSASAGKSARSPRTRLIALVGGTVRACKSAGPSLGVGSAHRTYRNALTCVVCQRIDTPKRRRGRVVGVVSVTIVLRKSRILQLLCQVVVHTSSLPRPFDAKKNLALAGC